MRVLVVTTWLPTPASPTTGIFVARDIAALAEGHEVHVLHLCAPGLAGAGPVPGLPPTVSVERIVMDPRRPNHLARAARRIRALAAYADLLHTMAISVLLPLAAGRPRLPWVHTEHWSGLLAPETLPPAVRAARPVVLRLLRRPDVVAVVSEHLAQGVRALREGPVAVVPNIVESPTSLHPRQDPGRSLPGGPLELVGVGALIERKDPVTAVLAAAELRRRSVDARLTWVGTGELADEVSRRAAAEAVPLRLLGAVPPREVPGVVGAADLFLLPTRAETFCVAAAEALAAGRPVVVGDSGGPREFVAPPSGLLVTPGAPPTTWADAVEQVWAATADHSAAQIAAPITSAYSPEAWLERVSAIYASLQPVTPTSHRRDTGSPADPVSRLGQGGGAPSLGSPGDPVSRPPDTSPLVDVVIATHSARRQTERAVRSVLDGSRHGSGVATGNGVDDVDVRVTVVCHGIAPDEITASWAPTTLDDPRVRLLEHHDGVRSPAGPFTAGLDAAEAPWVSVLGSDDQLAPGALAHWLEVAERTGAEVVLAEIALDGAPVPTPPTRVRAARSLRRHTDLDLVRDRLSYRSAPLGLLSRNAIARTGARLLPAAATGEDIPFITRLLDGARVALADRAPYLVGTDADDRTTAVPRPVRDELLAVSALVDDPWFRALPTRRRTAVATKLLRIHLFGTVLNRPDPAWWTAEERGALAQITQGLLTVAPGCAAPLSVADHALLTALLDPAVPTTTMLDAAHARRRHGTPRTLLPHDWRYVLHREAPLRFMAASLAARRG